MTLTPAFFLFFVVHRRGDDRFDVLRPSRLGEAYAAEMPAIFG